MKPVNNIFDLTILEEKKDTILQAEVAAYLHDVGKMCLGHLRKHTIEDLRNNPDHKFYIKNLLFEYEQMKYLESFLKDFDNPLYKRIKKNFENNPNNPTFVINNDLHKNFKKEIPNMFNKDFEKWRIDELIFFGNGHVASNQQLYKDNLLQNKDIWLPSALAVCQWQSAYRQTQITRRKSNLEKWGFY